jgi:hypothetical protein
MKSLHCLIPFLLLFSVTAIPLSTLLQLPTLELNSILILAAWDRRYVASGQTHRKPHLQHLFYGCIKSLHICLLNCSMAMAVCITYYDTSSVVCLHYLATAISLPPHRNIIIPSVSKSPKLSLPLRLSKLNFICISNFQLCVLQISSAYHHWLYHSGSRMWKVWIMKVLIINVLHSSDTS